MGLNGLEPQIQGPWLLLGDFNTILEDRVMENPIQEVEMFSHMEGLVIDPQCSDYSPYGLKEYNDSKISSIREELEQTQSQMKTVRQHIRLVEAEKELKRQLEK
ncbi:hypothetical protein HAX54_041805 [Datura stramonium]|uniref:Uncharacterized protein n=1 Tax=Datura stramonium TaxID=4076 RepID=A0ABS8VXX0_DATST|nr:hypothetical protein [Datura stramonium]